MRPRTALALVPALTAALLAAGALPARAAAMPDTVDQNFQANGRVAAVLAVGNVLYLGGEFTSLRPYGNTAGVGEVPRDHLAAIDRDTGALLPWNPGADKGVYALAASFSGATIVVGGHFTTLGGVPRQRLGSVTSAGAVTAWAPSVDTKVLSIALGPSRIYVGGTFATVDGQARSRLAAFSSSGVLDGTWQPTADDRVRVMTLAADGTVLVGGDFTTIGGLALPHLVRLSATSGASLAWSVHPDYPIYDLQATSTAVYAAGNGTGGHVDRYSTTGVRTWSVQTDGGVQAVAMVGGAVFGGGHFDNICSATVSSGGSLYECPSSIAVRHKLVGLDEATGTLLAWNPGADSSLGVFALTPSGSRLAAGGDFTRIGHLQRQQALAEFG